MTASAAALNALYGVGTARLGGGWVTMFPSGASLALLTATLSLLATVSTVGVELRVVQSRWLDTSPRSPVRRQAPQTRRSGIPLDSARSRVFA